VGSSRLFVLDMVQHRIVAVDLATGFRSILSSDLVGNGPSIARGIALELDGPRSRLVVAQDATPSGSSAPFPPLLTVDLATGDRAELADPTPLDGIELEQPQDLAFDAAQDRLLALDRGSVYAIDPASGERTLVADGGRTDQGPSLFHGEALALDAARHVALVAGGTAAFRGLVSILIAIDLEQPQRAVLSISR